MKIYGTHYVAPAGGSNGEGLAVFLLPLNDPAIRERIGKENLQKQEAPFMHTLGQRYRYADSEYVQGGRLLYVGDTSIIGAINFTKRGWLVVISNIFVDRAHRRQGIATKMVQELRKGHKHVMVDGSMTLAGKAFFDTIP